MRSGIWIIMRIGLQKLISCPCPDICRHVSCKSISMRVFLSNLANRQTNEHGQKHVAAPLSKVITRSVAAGFG